MRIGICTSGGDCAGLNAAIYSAVKYASTSPNIEILGMEGGFDALLSDMPLRPLSREDVRGIVGMGGTILHTSNKGSPFRDPSTKDQAIADMVAGAKRHKLDAIIVIGGEGSHGMAQHLLGQGIQFVGIGKTIDNDMCDNELTIGFKSAVDVARSAAENLICSAKSHRRAMFLEVMGRDSGFLALEAGLACEADLVLIPEVPFSMEKTCAHLKKQIAKKHYAFGIISEGATVIDGGQNFTKTGAAKEKLGGVSDLVVNALWDLHNIESRAVKLGHVQRGSVPNADDRLLALQLGIDAVDCILESTKEDKIIVMKDGKLTRKPYKDFDFSSRRKIDLNSRLVHTAHKLGVFIG